jgi:SAM-dependent methyltransferase
MYLALASASDGPVLELGCGTGRIAIPLAEAGHRVTGVDRDRFMLERATAAWSSRRAALGGAAGSLELVQADITELRLARRFDLVILGLNTILMLPGAAARGTALTTIRDHLSADGRAVIDAWLPAPEDLELYDGRVIEDWQKIDDESGERISKSTTAQFDPQSRVSRVETFYDVSSADLPPRRITRTDEIHFVTADELVADIELAGLRPQALIGDHALTEFTPDSERLIAFAAGSVPSARADGTNRPGPSRLL